MKKFKIVIILLLVAILSGCSIWGGPKPVELPQLEATSEDVVLGKTYETATTITDANGKVYEVVDVTVYRLSDGKQVTLIYGLFDVANLLGYKIVYTVESDGYTATQTHTLRVIDEGKPTFSVESKHIAEVGVKYTFPAIKVRDDSKANVPYTITVYRTGETLQQVPQEADGFTPDASGYYELHIRAEDAAGNVTEEVYEVYARNTKNATEVDAFDDEGLLYTSYFKSGTKKQQTSFSSFRRLTTSKGSAYFISGSGTHTEFYVQPRNSGSVVDNLGKDGYVSVWMYISTLRDSTKMVYVGSTVREIPTNSWQELKITADMVDMWKAYFSRLETYSMPLLSVANDGEDYVCFIDDIYAMSASKNTVEISTLKAGEELDVTVTNIQNPVYEYYYGGEPKAFNGKFAPTMEGKYIVSVYSDDRAYMHTKEIIVGDMYSEVRSTAWYVVNEETKTPSLNVYRGQNKVSANTQTWLVDMNTWEKTPVGDTFTTDKHLIGLYSESVIDGKTTSLFQILSLHDTPFGRWFDTDNPDVVNGFPGGAHINFTWLEEYKGETGVIAIENTTGAEGFFANRKYWNALYPKEHYKRGTKIVFRMMAEGHTRIDYLAEYPKWTPGCGQSGIAGEWTDYAFDFDVIYNNFEGFANYAIFYILGEPNTLYISDIFVIVEDKVENVNLLQGSSYNVSSHASFEGCDITECEVTHKGTKVSVNGTTFLADKEGTYQVYVSGYDHMGLFFENTFNVFSNASDTWHAFSDESSVPQWIGSGSIAEAGGTANATWLESYAGADGVLKLAFDLKNAGGDSIIGGTANINWPSVFSKEHYGNANMMTFRIKIEGDAAVQWGQSELSVFGINWGTNYGKIFTGQGDTDGWKEFVLPVDVAQNYDALNGMFLALWTNRDVVIYIDEITAWYLPPVVEPEGTWNGFSTVDSASGLVMGGAITSWLESYEGATGVLKISQDNGWVGNDSGITWQPAFDAAAYEGATGLKFRMKLEGANLHQLTVFAAGNADRIVLYQDQGNTNGWVEFVWNIDVKANYDILKGMYFVFWSSQTTGAAYIDSIAAVYP